LSRFNATTSRCAASSSLLDKQMRAAVLQQLLDGRFQDSAWNGSCRFDEV